MLTDDEIRALRDKADGFIAELCTRVLASEARVRIVDRVARDHGWIIDENGNCGWVGVWHLKDRIKVLEDALEWTIDFCDQDEVELNTIQERARAALVLGKRAAARHWRKNERKSNV